MADISLLFDVSGGGSIGSGSGKLIADQLAEITANINKNPFKIKFEPDKTSLNSIRDSIKKITEDFTSNGSTTQKRVSKRSTNSKKSSNNDVKLISKNTREYGEALSKVNNLLANVRENIKKWTAAESGKSSESYKALIEQEKALTALEDRLKSGQATAEEFRKSISLIKGETSDASEAIKSSGENGASQISVRYKDASDAIKEYYKLRKSIIGDSTDIVKEDGKFTSPSGQWTARVDALNRAREACNAYLATAQKEKLSAEEQLNLDKLLSSEKQKLALAIETAANKTKAASQASSASIAATKEQVDVEKTSSKTIADSLATRRTQLDTFIEHLKTMQDKAKEYNARINHSFAYDDNGSIISAPIKDTDKQRSAADALENLINMVGTYRDTLSGDTETATFTNNLGKFKTEFESIKTAVDAFKTSIDRYRKAAKENLKDTNALSKAIISTNKAYKQATDAVQKYTAAKNGKSSREYADLERAADSLKVLNDRLNSGTISEREYVEETNRLQAVVQQSTAIIKANGEAHLSLGDKIKLTAQKFTQYFTIARVVQTAWQAVNKMVSMSIELDSAFTQLKIVTGATDAEMEDFSATAINLSKNLGQSVTDVTKSIETFSRLGYELPDASKLAEYATILANTAAVSTDEATTGLTSIIKGFNMDVSEAEHVSDVLIEVGQKYAVSAGEMMEAYARSGAALKATNVSFEKSAGLIAAANASIQNSAVVGTALKTVSARIRGSKTDLEELGEDTEELAEGFSKYAKELKALTGFDIMLEGSTTEFKDMFDILGGIAKVWRTLSDTSQARVAEILGGTKQLQVIASIIGNWKDAAGAYSAAMNSAGVATKANDIYMTSAQAHINQLKATFEELSSDIASSDLIKFGADFASGILSAVDAVTKFADSLGTIPVLVSTISAALSFKNVGELINQFRFLIILRIEYAHEALN